MQKPREELLRGYKVNFSYPIGNVERIIYTDCSGGYFNIEVPLVNGVKEGRADLFQGIRKVATLSYKDDEINGICFLYGDHNEVVEEVNVVNGLKDGPYTRYDRNGSPIERGEYTDSPSRPSPKPTNPSPHHSYHDPPVSDFSSSSSSSGYDGGFDGGSLFGVLGAIATVAAVGYGVKKAADYFSRDDRPKQPSRNKQASRPTNPQNRNRQYGSHYSNSSNRPTESDNPFGFFF